MSGAQITVGMAIKNEARFLRQSLQAWLAQRDVSFRIRISDNASTDETPEICREFAASSPHVDFIEQTEDLGALENLNQVARGCDTPYFIWASGHDLPEPTLLARCHDVLQTTPEAVLTYPRAALIDGTGRIHGVMPVGPDTTGRTALGRLRGAALEQPNGNAILGLIRTSAMHQTALMRRVISADMVMLSELALLGPFVRIDDVLWRRREVRDPETIGDITRRQTRSLFREGEHVSMVRAGGTLMWTHLTAAARSAGPDPVRALAAMSIVALRYGVVLPWRWLVLRHGVIRVEPDATAPLPPRMQPSPSPSAPPGTTPP